MDKNISWKDVFISFFIKDLIYPVLLAAVIISEYLVFRFFYFRGLGLKSLVDLVGAISSFVIVPLISLLFLKFFKKLREKEGKAIDDFLAKKFEYKTPDPSAWDQASYATRLMVLHISHYLYLWCIFFKLYHGFYLLNLPF
jgi:hypothetical protein